MQSLAAPVSSASLFWTIATAIPVLALAIVTMINGAIQIMAPWDVFTLLEGGWRIHSGLVPHSDFYNPIGSLTYELVSIGMSIGRLSTASITYSIIIFTVCVIPWAWFVTSHRLSGFVSFVFTSFSCLLLVADRPLGYDPGITTYAMIYNRYAWVLLAILMIQLFVAPRALTKRGTMFEGMSIGGLLVLLFFCKVSDFGMGLVAMGVASVVRRNFLGSLIYAISTFVAGCFLWWVLFDVSTFAYIADLIDAAAAQSSPHRIHYLLQSVAANGWQVFCTGLLLLTVLVAPFDRSSLSRWWSGKIKLTIVVLFVLGTNFIIAAGNAPEGSDLPLFFVIGVIILEYVSRNVRHETSATLTASEITHVVALLIVIPVFVTPIAFKDARSIYISTVRKAKQDSSIIAARRFDSETLRDLVVPPTSQWQTAYWRASDVPARINEGIELLRRHVKSDTKLFAVAFTNPFSFALQLPPPKGPPLWWDINFSVSIDDFPPPDSIFAHVDMVIIPILRDVDDGCCKKTVREMLAIYGDFIEAHYQELDQTDNWDLMTRRP